MFAGPTISSRTVVLTFAAIALTASLATRGDDAVKLSGDQEVPAVTTKASGKAMIVIGRDKSVKGEVSTAGIEGTAAHIHVGRPGTNGPVAVPLAKNGSNGWSVPSGAKLSDVQYESYKAGDLYVNVHSANHPDGEIRAQLKP